jgi:hypothetical protein
MESVPIIVFKLYVPLIFMVASVMGLFWVRKGDKRILVKLKPFADFVDFEISISNLFAVRCLLIFAAAAFSSAYLFYDYVALFPQHYKMEVFYDDAGIEQSLRPVFTAAEIDSFSIPKDVSDYKAQYFRQLDSEVQRVFGSSQFFSIKEGYVHATGQAYTVGEKLEGWQNYHVAESEGELTHILEVPDLEPRQFYTRFEKMPSKDDYVSLTLADLLIKRSVVLRTQYKQILVQTKMSQGILFKVSVVGVTKLTIFPWPHVSNTVYFAKFQNAGLVPIAYAVYR